MFRYRVFGGILETDLDFPELPASSTTAARWTLTTSTEPVVLPPDATLLGTDQVHADITVQLYRTSAGYWLQYSDTGCFLVSPDGSSLTWHRPADSPGLLDCVRMDVIGRVIPMAIHAEGLLCLHGSAVFTGRESIGFLAPKLHGKSTIAMALVSAGGQLVTDDALVVDTDAQPAMALPGVHAMRLWGDSAGRLIGDDAPTAAEGDKHILRDLPESRRMDAPSPVGALYLLAPAKPDARRPAAVRRQLAPMEAALALVGHGKLTPLLGKGEAAVTLQRATAIARQVPVYVLSIVRDFSRISEAVEQLQVWHGPAGKA